MTKETENALKNRNKSKKMFTTTNYLRKCENIYKIIKYNQGRHV